MAELQGTYRAAFNGTDFNRHVTNVRDQFGPRFVQHTIPHRTGAKQEEMGPIPVKTMMDLQFAGRTWRSDVEEKLEPMLKRPRGDLMHPIFGPLKMVLTAPIDTKLDLVNKGNLYEVTLTFAEDTLTNDLSLSRGPQAIAQDLLDLIRDSENGIVLWAAVVIQRAAVFVQDIVAGRVSLAQAAVETFTGAARAYVEKALDQIQLGFLAPELDLAFQQLPVLCQRGEQALREVDDQPAEFYELVQAQERALITARDLNAAMRAAFPPPTRIRVPARMSLHRLVDLRYAHLPAAERLARLEHIARVNRLARIDSLSPNLMLVVPLS